MSRPTSKPRLNKITCEQVCAQIVAHYNLWARQMGFGPAQFDSTIGLQNQVNDLLDYARGNRRWKTEKAGQAIATIERAMLSSPMESRTVLDMPKSFRKTPLGQLLLAAHARKNIKLGILLRVEELAAISSVAPQSILNARVPLYPRAGLCKKWLAEHGIKSCP